MSHHVKSALSSGQRTIDAITRLTIFVSENLFTFYLNNDMNSSRKYRRQRELQTFLNPKK